MNPDLTFTDRLRERREQLFGAGDPLGLTETPQGQAVQRAADISAERQGAALAGETEFQAQPSDIFSTEEFFLGRAGNFLQPLIDNALKELEVQDAKAKAEMTAGGLMIDPETGEIMVDPEVERDAQSIMQGVMKLTDVAMDRRGAVAQRMAQLGYDPAVEVKSLLGNMEALYFGEGDQSISVAGVPIVESLKKLGLTFGKEFKTQRGQRAELYEDTREGFTSALRNLASQTGQLNEREFEALQKLTPSIEDTPEQARLKFSQLRGQIAAKFGGGTGEPLALGSEGQSIFGIPTAQATTGTGAGVDPYVSELQGLSY
jgi:hypothetical protein